jgi:NIMA (never in mitosis gene a)-related kinase
MSGHIDDYEVLNVIGTGSFGTCYKVQKKSNGHLYVWKAIGYGGMSEEKKQVCLNTGLLKKHILYYLNLVIKIKLFVSCITRIR